MIKTLHIVRLFLAGLLASLALGAHAQLSIEITGTGASRFPVIIPIFENEEWVEWTVVALSLRITKDRRQISDELYLLYRGMFANA